MNLAQFVVQWVHVLLGILWFGYALSMYFLVTPALARLPESAQREANLHLGELGAKVFPVVGGLVLLLGFVGGTILGPIDSVGDVFGTAYGLTWLVALLATMALFVTGARLLGLAFRRIEGGAGLPGGGGPSAADRPVRPRTLPRDLHLHDPDAVRALGPGG